MKIISLVLMATLTAAGQQLALPAGTSGAGKKDLHSDPNGVIVAFANPIETPSLSVTSYQYLRESLDKTGYRLVFTDTSGQFRCYVTASTVDSVTIVCVTPHKVETK